MDNVKLNPADEKYAVYFTKIDVATLKVYEAGTILFNSLNAAIKFANEVKKHPECQAQIFQSIGSNYNDTDEIDSLI